MLANRGAVVMSAWEKGPRHRESSIPEGVRAMFQRKFGIPVQRYDPRNGACVQQGNATTAEANREKFEADFAQQGKVVETGWKFARTAQTPPPGPPNLH